MCVVEVTMPESTTFAARLRRARIEKGLSQERLARLADVSSITVSRIERGIAVPTVETAQRLARALGVSIAWLLGEDEGANQQREEQPDAPRSG
jgi:transcriptional regulator with XRE-family HTH domain